MRTILSVLVLFAASVWPPAAQSAEDNATPQAKAGVAETHRWVNEGGPYGGDVFAVTLCAGSPDVLYAATSNGVFKSTDGAATWQSAAPLRRDGHRAYVRDVSVDSTDPDVVYAAAEELYKSTDGGASWTELPLGGMSGGANGVEVDPKEPNTVYVWNQSHGVYKSTDGGDTWELKSTGLSNSAFWSFEVDSHFPATLYAVTWCKKATYVSDDGGATWSKSTGTIENLTIKKVEKNPDNPRSFTLVLVHNDRELIFESPNNGLNWSTRSRNAWYFMPMQLSIDKRNPKSMSLPILNQDARDVYVTTDGAETWHPVELPFKSTALKAIRADSTRAGILYAATRRDVYYFSDDGGESWDFFYSAESDPDAEQTATIDELRTCFLYRIGRVDERFRSTSSRMIPHPSNPDIVYGGVQSSAGVLKTEDFGKHWAAANQGLSAYPTRAIACDGETPGVVYACSANAVHKSTDGGKTWKETKPTELVNATLLAVHPLDPQIVLVAKKHRRPAADISTDGGETWRQIDGISANRVEAIVFDSKNADAFYILTDAGIFETTDRGRTWRSTGRSFKTSYHMLNGNSPGTCQTVADVIYQTHQQRKLLRSTDVGQTWEELKLPQAGIHIQCVCVHPVDPKIVVVADLKGKLFISNDAGETWRAIRAPRELGRGGWRVRCIGMDPAHPDVFYVSCPHGGEGILRTQDGGNTFEQIGDRLPGVVVMQIVVSPADGAVYAATNGAGVYRLEIEKPTSDEAADE